MSAESFSRRGAARLVAGALALCAAPTSASSMDAAHGAKASIDLRIVIPVVLRAEDMHDPRALALAPEDVARGYVDVEQGTSLLLTSNTRAGFAVSIAADPAIVSRVVARFEGQSLESAAPAMTLHVDAPQLLREPVVIRYRLFLAPGALAGSYAWPVRLAFAPGA